MTLQRRLLHAMLGLLALAAVAGISTIFLPGGDFLFRVAGTLAIAAVAIAMAIPTSKLLDRQSDRTRGLVSLLAIVIGFCLSTSAIWCEYMFQSMGWQLGLSTTAYAVCAVSGLVFLSVFTGVNGRHAGAAGMGCAAAVFISWLLAIWWGWAWAGSSWTDVSERWAATAGFFAVGTVPIAASLYGRFQDGRHWRLAGVLAGIGGVVLGLIGTWLVTGGEPTILIHCLIVSATIGGLNVLTRLELPRPQVWLGLATTGMLLVSGLLGMIVNQLAGDASQRSFDDIDTRLLIASLIVTTCGILAIAVLKAFNRRFLVTEARSIADFKVVSVQCPRCSRKRDAAIGESRCAGCNLILVIQVAEPHCRACGYVLLDLRGDRCPECGETIAGGLNPTLGVDA